MGIFDTIFRGRKGSSTSYGVPTAIDAPPAEKPALDPIRRTEMTKEEALLEQRIVCLEGEINHTSASRTIMQLLYLQDRSRQQPIRLLINSGGGVIDDALGIYDVIRYIAPQVWTHCDVMATGVALFLTAAGENGHRTTTPTALLGFGYLAAKSDQRYDPESVERTKSTLLWIYRRHSKMSEEQIVAGIDCGTQFAAAEAIEFGLIDQITPQRSFGYPVNT